MEDGLFQRLRFLELNQKMGNLSVFGVRGGVGMADTPTSAHTPEKANKGICTAVGEDWHCTLPRYRLMLCSEHYRQLINTQPNPKLTPIPVLELDEEWLRKQLTLMKGT